ncbi:glycosyltransferase family 4 protein [Deferribacteres bacterium DY0037]
MKILFVNEYIGTPYHGMVYRQYYLAREMVARGHEVWIVTASNSHLLLAPPKVNKDLTHEVVDGINYLWVRMPYYKYSKSFSRIRNMFLFMIKLLRLDISRFVVPDFIIASSPSVFSIKIALKWKKRTKAKVVFEVMDIWPLTLTEFTCLSKLNPLIRYMKVCEKAAYSNADAVVSVLDGFARYLSENGYDVKAYACIPNGVYLDEASFETNTDSNDKLSKIDCGKITVGYVGTLGIANSLNSFINVALSLKEDKRFQFVLVGDGNERSRLEALANGAENIVFTGSVSRSDVKVVYEKLDICYFGVLKKKVFEYGISPTKLPDYMYSGKPVIGAVSNYTDLIEHSRCGITVEAENVEEIVSAIMKLANDKEACTEMGARGRSYVTEKLSYHALADRFIEFLLACK